MSLHLGTLSSRVRRDEVERVFRRFGRCSVQVKDKFGFIVYDYPVNAERALKTLRGKKICGEKLTLSWSNKQPKPLLRTRGRKSHDSRLIRNSTKENYVNRKLSSDGRQDSRLGRLSSPPVDINGDPDDATTHGMKESSADGNEGPTENFLENDRWGDQIDDIPNGNDLKSGSEFDRYEPYSGDEKRDNDEFKHAAQIGKEKMDPVVTVKTHQGCYNCGELGHKMRNCPQDKASNKKFNRLYNRHNDKSNYNGHREDEQRKVEFERMKRTRESESLERHHVRKSRRPNYSKSATRFAPNSNFRSCSMSSSTFSSKSHSCAFGNHRSKPRSGSKSRSSSHASLYVSTSSGWPSTSPPMKQTGEKDSFTKSPSPEQNKAEIKSAKLMDTDAGFDDPKLDTIMTMEKGNEEETHLDTDNIQKSEEETHLDTDNIQKSEEETHLDEGIHPSDPLLEVSSPISQQGTMNLQICDLNTSEHPPTQIRKSLRLTPIEMLMVIKHYGLKQPEGVDKDLPVEAFFGAARLWPWEVIYYRRHKKGPISTENYARRISQNQEFGIVDKYVRSSSGWGELGEDDL